MPMRRSSPQWLPRSAGVHSAGSLAVVNQHPFAALCSATLERTLVAELSWSDRNSWRPFPVLNEYFQTTGATTCLVATSQVYTDKQKRQAEHIEEGYEHRGVSEKEAERRAWATVNKETHGGKKSGSGRGTKEDHSPSRKGGRLGGAASAKRPASERSRSAKKAAKTRKRRAA